MSVLEKQNRLYAFLLLVVVFFFQESVIAYGAGTEGHGGGVLICPNPNDDPQISLLDFVESTWTKPSPSRNRSMESWMGTAQRELKRMDPGLAYHTDQAMGWGQAIIRKPPAGYKLTSPGDVNLQFIPQECQLVALASWYDDENVLYVDQLLMSQMSGQDRAGFWMHEAIYKVLRIFFNEQDSVHTRALVRRAFKMGEENVDIPVLPIFPRRNLQNLASLKWSFPESRQQLENSCPSKRRECTKALQTNFLRMIGLIASQKEPTSKQYQSLLKQVEDNEVTFSDAGFDSQNEIQQWVKALAITAPESMEEQVRSIHAALNTKVGKIYQEYMNILLDEK